MYYEEQFINGALCFRSNPRGEWTPLSAAQLNDVIREKDNEIKLLRAEKEKLEEIKRLFKEGWFCNGDENQVKFDNLLNM